MSKILGLDLGTNSIGWAIVDEQQTENKIPEKGVTIFPLGVKSDKGNESSKAAERTEYRSARRLKYRRKVRKYNTLKVLIGYKLCPLDETELEKWMNEKIYPSSPEFLDWLRTHEDKNPYYFRNLVSKQKLDLSDENQRFMLGRAFYHIAQRRGFKSNRLDGGGQDDTRADEYKPQIQEILDNAKNMTDLQTEMSAMIDNINPEGDEKLGKMVKAIERVTKKWETAGKRLEEEKIEIENILNREDTQGKVKTEISKLNDKIQKSGCDTLGQYFYSQHQTAERIRDNYTHREEHYEKEFNIICEKQELEQQLVDKLYNAIFYQRPLRSQKGLVGKCTFEPNKPRCPISHPDYEKYRMLGFINNIKWKAKDEHPADFKPLTEEMRKAIVSKFYRIAPQFKFEDLAKEITTKILGNKKSTYNYYRDKNADNADYHFNYSMHTSVSGCPIGAKLKNIFGEDWENLQINYTYNYLNKKTGTTEQRNAAVNYEAIWHVLFSFEDEKMLKEYGKTKLKLNEKQLKAFIFTIPKQGYASISLKAIRKIIPFLEKGFSNTQAIFLANVDEVVGEKIWKNNKDLIIEELSNIIKYDKEYKTKMQIINDLIGLYNKLQDDYTSQKYSSQNYKELNEVLKKYRSISDYILDNDTVDKKAKQFFGNATWNGFSESKITTLHDDIIQLVKSKIEKHIPQFYKIKRIDDRFKEFLINNFLSNATTEEIENQLKKKKEKFKTLDDKQKAFEKERLNKLYHPSDIAIYPKSRKIQNGKIILDSPLTDSVKNPVVMKALHELRQLINTLILEEKINPDTKIYVELAREMNDANKRAAIKTYQSKREAENEDYKKEIQKCFKSNNIRKEPSKEDIDKYRLWIEQKRHCIYTGDEIPIEKLFDGESFDIEHTIPRSQSYDDSLANKTVCESKFNRSIKKNNIPTALPDFDKIENRLRDWKKKISDLKVNIENAKKRSKATQEKEAKDRAIQDRHVLQMEYDYWQAKYNRFLMKEVPEGFKNSQLNDTRSITKLTLAYLKTVFKNVKVLNGEQTSNFRKVWGLQDEYVKKQRNNHIHHAIDAAVVALATERLRDRIYKTKLERFFEENYKKKYKNNELIKELRAELMPWENFVPDIKRFEDEILIYHTCKDNTLKQTKRKIRKRGKIQYVIEFEKDSNGKYKRDKKGKKIPCTDNDGKLIYKLDENGKRIPRYEQGLTFRNSIHEATVYGQIFCNYEPNPKKQHKFVSRFDKSLGSLTKDNLKNIVDKRIQKAIEKQGLKEVQKNGLFLPVTKLRSKDNPKKKILLTDFKNKKDVIEHAKNNHLKRKLLQNIEKDGFETAINKGLSIEVKTVRCIAKVTNPIHLKPNRDKSKKGQEYKENVYVNTEGNYLMALYEGVKKDKIAREVKPISYHDAATMLQEYNITKQKPIIKVPETINKLPLKTILHKGTLVLFYQEHPDEIDWNNSEDLTKRLYVIREIARDGRIKLKFHQNTQNDDALKAYFTELYGKNYESTLLTGRKIYEHEHKYPKLHISKGNYNFLINGIDFKISPAGKIALIEK